MTKDLRFAFAVSLIALVVGQMLAATDIAQSILGDVASMIKAHTWILLTGTLLGDAYVLYALSRPNRRELVAVTLVGTLLSAILFVVAITQAAKISLALRLIGAISTGLGSAALAILIWHARYAKGRQRDLARHLLVVTGVIGLMALSMGALLNVGIALQPKTFDLILLHVDESLGLQASTILGLYGLAYPWFKVMLGFAYAALAVLSPALYALQLRGERAPPVSIMKVWMWAIPIVYFSYFLLPVSGPLYLFGAEMFPAFVPLTSMLPVEMVSMSPTPRNGVPSMHIGWALLFWMNAGLLPNRRLAKYLRAFGAVFLGMTALATLGLGEHYLIDLVIAIPFIVGLQALCMDSVSWRDKVRLNACVAGFGIALMWILALRYSHHLFISVPGLTWVCVVVTVLSSIMLYKPLARRAVLSCESLPPMPLVDDTKPVEANSKHVRYVGAMFVISGIAGIMYEVLFSKALALTFGSTSTATYTVLATYMGGIAIGAWLGGRIGATHNRPLLLYAGCELAIAVYCALTPSIFAGIQAFYVSLASGVAPDAPILLIFRLALGVAALLLPTILMGMTLPVLARFIHGRIDSLGRTVSVLYGANTLGAALGALLAGYWVLPALGVFRTTLMAALLNLIVALLAIELHKRLMLNAESRGDSSASKPDPAIPVLNSEHRWLGLFALVVLGIGGAITLAMEIKYFHLLAVVAGNSTYAFSLMLFTFLLGLGAGAECARRMLGWKVELRPLLGWLELGLACVILAGVFLWGSMPDYFASYSSFPMVKEFGSREFVRAVVCWLAMFPPAFFIGAIYPVAMECIGRARTTNPVRALGYAAALNTTGNIVGVLIGAFVLMPVLGALRSIQLLGVICAVLGIVALWGTKQTPFVYRWAPAALAAILLTVQPSGFNYDKLASGANVYFYEQGYGKTIDHADSIDGGLTTVAVNTTSKNERIHTLLTNGKFQGNDSMEGEMKAQIGFALSPLLHTPHRDSALVIGYGTGVSARTLHEAGFRQMDIVELSADILRMADKHFSGVNALVSKAPGVNTYITDGRNYLMLQDRKYDLIGLEVSSIWFAGAASLYNREFYALTKKRLHPHGVLQQWTQLHHITQQDLLRILGSARAEFKYVWLYEIGGQGIIIATDDAAAIPNARNVALLKSTESLEPLLKVLASDPGDLSRSLVLDPVATDRLLGSFGVPPQTWISTDDNLYLEYSTPRGNVLDGYTSFRDNLAFLRQHGGGARQQDVASSQ